MKNLYQLVFAAVCILQFAISSISVSAAGNGLDMSRKASLIVEISDPETGLVREEAAMILYKAVSFEEKDGQLQLIPAKIYDELNLDFTDLNASKEVNIAGRLAQYIETNKIEADYYKKSSIGKYAFDGLDIGIYLAVYQGAEQNGTTVTPFLVTLPAWDEKNEKWLYERSIHPKHGIQIPEKPEPPDKEKPGPPTPGPPQNNKPPQAGKLPQTGVLKWPIPVLSLSGLVLLCAGWRIRKNRDNGKKRTVIVFITAGAALVTGALSLHSYNIWDEQRALAAAAQDVPELMNYILQQEEVWEPEYQLEHITDTGEYSAMETLTIDANEYVGVISIPGIEIALPVFSQWSYPLLRIGPCVYTGNYKEDSMVIMAHNYDSHFGRLDTLKTGDSVHFTNVEGEVCTYIVGKIEYLGGTEVEKMTADESDLTLFTCTYGGSSRVAVRCYASGGELSVNQ